MSGKGNKIFEGIDFSGFDALDELDAASKRATASSLDLPLSSIIEDPEQPRKVFDEASLNELAESIRERDVLQPITVRPPNMDGKHVIVMGARRYRASLLAGKETIPAVIRVRASDGYDQMIENIQREALSHRDIATFIRDQLATGAKKSAVAKSLGKPPAWVTAYADFFHMDPAIQDGMEEYGTRAAYELHAAMQIDAEKTRAFINSGEPITQRSAVAFRQSLKIEQTTPSTPQEPVVTALAESTPAVEPRSSDDNPKGTTENQSPLKPEGASPVSATPAAIEAMPPLSAPVPSSSEASETEPLAPQDPAFVSEPFEARVSLAMRVRAGERVGRLLLDRKAEQGGSFGVVVFDDGGEQEAKLSDLILMELVEVWDKDGSDA